MLQAYESKLSLKLCQAAFEVKLSCGSFPKAVFLNQAAKRSCWSELRILQAQAALSEAHLLAKFVASALSKFVVVRS